ncbi:unnamed protein product [Arctogadus glacialis]
MLAARVGGGPAARIRKQSVASVSRRGSQDVKRGTAAAKQPVFRSSKEKAVLIREIEIHRYLKMLGLGKDEILGSETGMTYRVLFTCAASVHP